MVIEEMIDPRWLSPEVVTMLIDRFALRSPTLGALKWEYSDILQGNRWGQYDIKTFTLKVSKLKTRGQFEQQVKTILHEIRHWNQHASFVEQVMQAKPEETVEGANLLFMYKCNKFAKMSGYVNSPFEEDARDFTEQTFSRAMNAVNKALYSDMIRGIAM
jgi:hypothetical protein